MSKYYLILMDFLSIQTQNDHISAYIVLVFHVSLQIKAEVA